MRQAYPPPDEALAPPDVGQPPHEGHDDESEEEGEGVDEAEDLHVLDPEHLDEEDGVEGEEHVGAHVVEERRQADGEDVGHLCDLRLGFFLSRHEPSLNPRGDFAISFSSAY